MTVWFEESDSEDLIIRFGVSAVIAKCRTDYQDLVIFDSPRFGRALALDGIVQLTEADEFVYHEMIAHVPLLAHGRASRVLIVGGGDGGTLREVLRHPVEAVTLVELDPEVVAQCRAHMASLSDGAFDDPRLDLRFEDGVAFAANAAAESFDIVLVDSTDPLPGPGEVLFSESFYRDCKRLLTPGGVLISQLGMPFLYPEAVRGAHRRLAACFEDTTLYLAAVPVFAGGYMAFAWASDDPALRRLPTHELGERLSVTGLAPRFYTPAFHQAAFVLPRDIAGLLTGG